MDIEQYLFPFSQVREEQREFLSDVAKVVEAGGSLLAHAPTGIGKTAASLSPALAYALKNGKSILFLTPKHSQHHIVVETLRRIRDKYGKRIIAVDIIGKQWTCLYDLARDLAHAEFTHFCQAHKKNETCSFMNNCREGDSGKLTQAAREAVEEIKMRSPAHNEEILEVCKRRGICPYETCVEVGKSANVIICDYYHVFHPEVRRAFIGRLVKEFEDLVLIIDEAHNLPERVRKLMSHSITEYSISNAIKEANALHYENLSVDLEGLLKTMKLMGKDLSHTETAAISTKDGELLVNKHKFVNALEAETRIPTDELINELENLGENVLEQPDRYRSYSLAVAGFLREWASDKNEAAYVRILDRYKSETGWRLQLSLRCLDPALFTQDVLRSVHASILMSGTLLPLEMYKTVLGLGENTLLREYRNPFPPENRLILLTRGTTTRYSCRSPYMYKKIADTIFRTMRSVPGNIAIFFTSYSLLEEVLRRIIAMHNNPVTGATNAKKSDKEFLVEKREMKRQDRLLLYRRLKELQNNGGGALFAVQAGSFSEGMDFPDKMLDCVVIVGLPLERPNLESRALINYYDFKFNRGWDYGYIYPAMNRALQAAGRGIRSEKDRGAVVFMDDRFQWSNYSKCLPQDIKLVVSEKPEEHIERFFAGG